MTEDLKLAFGALSAKQALYTKLYNYYDGNQPLVYSTERLREAFEDIKAHFEQNWCAVVIDSVQERLTLKGWDVSIENDQALAEEANAVLDSIWIDQHLELEAFEAHEAALVTGEAYLIAWPDLNDEERIAVYWNDPRLCHLVYDSERPKTKRFAAKWWVGEDGRRYVDLYYPEYIEHYVSRGKGENLTSANALDLQVVEENPYKEVPVFHLRRHRRARTSELTNVVHLQDAVNKLLADMMVAAEFGAFPQRYVISAAEGASKLKNAPSEIWDLAAGMAGDQPTSAGQFEAADLGNYLNAIDKLASSIAIITRTPKHYFYGQGANISGEALLAMEAPLVHKARQYQERFSITWQNLGRFILKLQGMEVPTSAILPIWAPVETVQPLTQAQVREAAVRANIPLHTILRREGWAQDEIDQMEVDRQAEEMQRSTVGRLALEEARRRLEQGEDVT